MEHSLGTRCAVRIALEFARTMSLSDLEHFMEVGRRKIEVTAEGPGKTAMVEALRQLELLYERRSAS